MRSALRILTLALTAFALVAATATAVIAGSVKQTASFVENPTGDDRLEADHSHLTRTRRGLSIRLQMETPEPGTYRYPDTVPVENQVAPEIFTGWAFVFANPGECKVADNSGPGPCNGDDFGDPDVGAGAYNFAGHATGAGGYLTISGHVAVGQTKELRAPGGNTPFPLSNPEGAEVHVAIAPHGNLDPSTLPAELNDPVGSPFCDCWWVAVFLPPA